MSAASGRAVMITGAAGNLGRAVAQAFVRQGDALVLVDVARDRLEAVYGGASDVLLAATDLLDPSSVRATVAAAVARFGGIDVLCNIAGGFHMGEPVHDTSPDDWSRMFDLNVRTLLNASHAVVPVMLAAGGGKIVNVGAFAALRGVARMGAYVAAKSAVIRLTESMAAELREHHVNVNCVLPTIIDTPENRAAMPSADPSRWVAPDDLANVIAFLASDDARAIHGAAIPVSGLS
jgi:NAD(P)-dependent dehydrogenase (short-subunit alcohol dehydrogenase family)